MEKVDTIIKHLNLDIGRNELKQLVAYKTRKNPGGLSNENINSGGYSVFQIFLLLKMDSNENSDDIISEVVEYLFQFFNCPLFKKQYI